MYISERMSLKARLWNIFYLGAICLIVLSYYTDRVLAKDCSKLDQCSCAFDDGTKVMLNSLGNSDGSPRFKDVASDDGSKYSYNPCYPFSEGGDCTGAAACELDRLGNADTIGEAKTAEFTYDGGNVIIGYTAGSGILTSTQVTLKCDLRACDPTLKADGSKGLQQYDLTLTTVCACPGGCDEHGPIGCSSGVAAGLSAGSLLLIAFSAFVFVYLIAGTIFRAVTRQARGVDMIPNVSFWAGLPGVIKDGFVFSLRLCKRGSS